MRSPIMIDEFHDTAHLIDVVIASSFIPLYLAPALTTPVEGGAYCDGGVIHMLPPVSAVAHSLPFNPSWIPHTRPARNSGKLISPALTPAFPFRPPQLLRLAMLPPSAATAQELFRWGEEAAHVWLDRGGMEAGPDPIDR